MATTWIPRTQFEKPREWLLANGEIVKEPPLEQSASGRKVRVAGTTMTAYSRDLDLLMEQAVVTVAQEKGTSVWMGLHQREQVMNSKAGFTPDETKASLWVVDQAPQARTRVWWRFRHPSLPIEALLVVQGKKTNGYGESGHMVSVGAVLPLTSPSVAADARYASASDTLHPTLAGLDDKLAAQEFLRDHPPAWQPDTLLGRTSCVDERRAVKTLLDEVRACDELESLQVLDLRDPDQPDWMDLPLHDTNCTAGFIADLVDHLDAAPAIDDALRIYDELRDCLRRLGMVLPAKSENDFHKGLLGEDPEGVTVNLGRALEEHGPDHDHTLRMHLPTGTFIVDCTANIPTEVIDRWEEAKVLARLTGEEDTLLAFAREATRGGQDKRARTIIAARTGTTAR